MSQITFDTEAIQQLAEAMRTYAGAALCQFDQAAQAWRALPEHWQGRTAEQIYDDLRRWLNQVEESSNMAKFMSQRLLWAKQCFEQADLDRLNSV
jgi:uncharacterized protein YukE